MINWSDQIDTLWISLTIENKLLKNNYDGAPNSNCFPFDFGKKTVNLKILLKCGAMNKNNFLLNSLILFILNSNKKKIKTMIIISVMVPFVKTREKLEFWINNLQTLKKVCLEFQRHVFHNHSTIQQTEIFHNREVAKKGLSKIIC